MSLQVELEELYNDLVINDVLPSSGFKDVQIPKIDGMYRVFKDR